MEEKKKISKLEKEIDWFLKEIEKDKLDLEREKEEFVNKIRNLKKEDILPKKQEKLNLWQKIKKSLMGY
jgi:hypothetical protein